MSANTEPEAIFEAMKALGCKATVQEVTAWVNRHYPRRWKDIGTAMADLTYPGNPSSPFPETKRFLERIGRGEYRIRSSFLLVQKIT
jgi:hypothetical protein